MASTHSIMIDTFINAPPIYNAAVAQFISFYKDCGEDMYGLDTCRESYLDACDENGIPKTLFIFHGFKLKVRILHEFEDFLGIPRSKTKMHYTDRVTEFIPSRYWRKNLFTWGLYASICRESLRTWVNIKSWKQTQDFIPFATTPKTKFKVIFGRKFHDYYQHIHYYVLGGDHPAYANCFSLLKLGAPYRHIPHYANLKEFKTWCENVLLK